MNNRTDEENLLRTTLDEMAEGLLVIDREWRYRYLNHMTRCLFGVC
jgi:PAS domain-containing protein